MNKSMAIVSFLFLILGLLLALAGRMLRSYRHSIAQLTGHTTGRVIDLQLREAAGRTGNNFRNQYYPVLEFYANGKLYKENYPYGAYPSAFKVGDKVSIDFDPADPHEYEIRRENISSFLPTLMYDGGIALAVAGAVLFILFIAGR